MPKDKKLTPAEERHVRALTQLEELTEYIKTNPIAWYLCQKDLRVIYDVINTTDPEKFNKAS